MTINKYHLPKYKKFLSPFVAQMAKISFIHFILIALIFSVACVVPLSYAEEEKDCRELLIYGDCSPRTCPTKCAQKQKNWRGECVPNPAREDFNCYCYWKVPKGNPCHAKFN
ncbi:hypothetical protein Tsubulata_018271 [Turnera subulata]|uniref:Knottin scorpion toxin-like domain-containing protein n=1 Tax=Turnera subulata TaxID=218843 RepID=A0A9Q0GAI4_9ROSI|nr:hypothetical protein Tsubulata_018271 [Turnera subulata]